MLGGVFLDFLQQRTVYDETFVIAGTLYHGGGTCADGRYFRREAALGELGRGAGLGSLPDLRPPALNWAA